MQCRPLVYFLLMIVFIIQSIRWFSYGLTLTQSFRPSFFKGRYQVIKRNQPMIFKNVGTVFPIIFPIVIYFCPTSTPFQSSWRSARYRNPSEWRGCKNVEGGCDVRGYHQMRPLSVVTSKYGPCQSGDGSTKGEVFRIHWSELEVGLEGDCKALTVVVFFCAAS